MYLEKSPDTLFTTTLVNIKYDCCQKEHTLKWKDANANYLKNNQKHVCRPCWLKTSNPAKRKEVTDKAKQTSLRKYGVTCALNTKTNIKARNEKMFGTDDSTKAIVDKRKDTCLDRYGVTHQMHLNSTKEKIRNTNVEKYGVDHAIKNEEVKNKTRETIQSRYGVDNVVNIPGTKTKMTNTNLERYGVEHYNQLPEMKDYLRENCKEWLADSYANPWAKGITRPEKWNRKQSETIANLIIEDKWSACYKSSKKGRYQSKKCSNKELPYFRSSYELMTHIWLDENPDVISYQYESLLIPYYDENKDKRYYCPDFLIQYLSTSQQTLLEVKNIHSDKLPLNRLKYKAAKTYSDLKNFNYIVWTTENIKLLKI